MTPMIKVFSIADVDELRNYARLKSPCRRGKFGALFITPNGNRYVASNIRLGNYCDDEFCARDYKGVAHVTNVEIGGEIHAEQALIAECGGMIGPDWHLMLVGVGADNKNLFGWENLPCHVCAMMIKYVGIKNVWLPYVGGPIPVSIDEILEYYERFD